MTTLVLGAAGVLGSAVVRLSASRGETVHAVVRPGTGVERFLNTSPAVVVHRLDLNDLGSLKTLLPHIAPERVVHAAFPSIHGQAGSDSRRTLLHALGPTLNVLEAIRQSGFDGHLVQLGSVMSYGPSASIHRVSDPLLPSTFRGAVKAAESLLVRQFGLETSATVTELRVATVYGPWEKRNRLIPSLFAAALTGERVSITAQPYLRDWIHVEDVARACLATEHCVTKSPKVFNIGTGILHSTHEIAHLAETITGYDLIKDESFQGRDNYGDPRPLIELSDSNDGLKWRPELDLESGFRDAWAWAQTAAGRRHLLSDRTQAIA